MFNRIIAFLYGVACYVAFLASFLYAIGFIGNFVVPKSIDSGEQMSLHEGIWRSMPLCSGLFAAQHSIMARQWFKRAWSRIVPDTGRAQHVRPVFEPRAAPVVLEMGAHGRSGLGCGERVRASGTLLLYADGLGDRARCDVSHQPF